MIIHRKSVMKFSSNKFILLTIFTLLFVSAVFAQTERDKGIELYKQGENSEAIKVLKKASKEKETKNDAEVWNILGLAYIKDNEIKEARKSFDKAVELDIYNSGYRANLAYAYFLEGRLNVASGVAKKAVELNSQNKFAYYTLALVKVREENYDEAIANLDKVLSIDEKFSLAYLLKSDIYILQITNPVFDKTDKERADNLFKQSINVLDICLTVCVDSGLQTAKDKLEKVKIFHDYIRTKKENVSAQEKAENTDVEPLKILAKPRADYTIAARENGVTGTIIAVVLFSANGEDKFIYIIKGLGYGLDEEVIKAARQIKFEPQKENGKSVSSVNVIQYHFAIH